MPNFVRNYIELLSINTHQGEMSDCEREARVSIAACYRLLAHYRLSDLNNGLIAGRVEDESDHCLVGRYGVFPEEVTASNLLKMSIHHTDGVEPGKDVVSAAVPLFQSLFRAFADVHCVIHAHTKATEVLSSLDVKLLPISHPGLIMHDKTGYVDYAYQHDAAFCEAMVDAFKGNRCLLLGNHGMITVGKTPAEAFFNTFTFDQACVIQLEACQSGQEIRLPDDVDTVSAAYAADVEAGVAWNGEQEWEGWLRMMDRKDPSYRD